MRDARCAMRDARCAMRDARCRCAMRDARCAMRASRRDARCAMRDTMRCAVRDAQYDEQWKCKYTMAEKGHRIFVWLFATRMRCLMRYAMR